MGTAVPLEARGRSRSDELAVLEDVIPEDRAGGDHRAVADADRADRAALAAEEDGGLVQHDAAGHVTEERGGRLVAVGREVEVDVGAAHLAVVLAAGAAGHQAVAEVDQAPERDEGKQDGLLEADAVGAVGLLLQEAAFADLGTRDPCSPSRGRPTA